MASERRPLRVNRFDRLLLRGRDPYQPVPFLLFARLVWALLAVVLLITLMAGLIAWSGQQRAKQICRERNVASVAYRDALGRLAVAAERRKDPETAAIFRDHPRVATGAFPQHPAAARPPLQMPAELEVVW